jgi:hypothetical protein
MSACSMSEAPRIAKRFGQSPQSTQDVISCLEAAGRTALSMPKGRYGPSESVTMNIDVVHEVIEAYGWNVIPLKLRPSAMEISQMEEAFEWLRMIDHKVIKQIVALRALNHPITERYLYSWRRLGRTVGADYKSVQLWHRNGIKIIFEGLDRLLKRH